MEADELIKRIHSGEILFSTSRSRGPGGQNVNKVNTKVELRFNVITSRSLTFSEKEKILFKLRRRINSDGEIIIVSQSERTQMMNRRKAEEKFYRLLADVLTDKPERKKTSATTSSKIKRLEKKRKQSIIKRLRKDVSMEE